MGDKFPLIQPSGPHLPSGAGTILGQGGQDRERQSREREIKFFCPKNRQKKGLRRIRSVFLSQKWLRIKVLGGAKDAQEGPKYLQGGSCPPYFPRLCTCLETGIAFCLFVR